MRDPRFAMSARIEKSIALVRGCIAEPNECPRSVDPGTGYVPRVLGLSVYLCDGTILHMACAAWGKI